MGELLKQGGRITFYQRPKANDKENLGPPLSCKRIQASLYPFCLHIKRRAEFMDVTVNIKKI